MGVYSAVPNGPTFNYSQYMQELQRKLGDCSLSERDYAAQHQRNGSYTS